jgi:DNA polymerase-3 subunit alpha
VVREGVRFGLAGVKNVGEGAIEAILEARASGPFASLFDFASRIDGKRVNRRVVESLVKCGAFDALHGERAEVWASLDVALEAGAAAQRDREIGQANLFGGASGGAPEPALVAAAPWTDRQRLEHEKEVLGFYVTGHPLSALSAQLARFADTRAGDTAGPRGPRRARGRDRHRAARDAHAARLADGVRHARGPRRPLRPGRVRRAVRAVREPAQAGAPGRGRNGPTPVLVAGTLEGGDPPKILVREVYELERAEEKLARELSVRIGAERRPPTGSPRCARGSRRARASARCACTS